MKKLLKILIPLIIVFVVSSLFVLEYYDRQDSVLASSSLSVDGTATSCYPENLNVSNLIPKPEKVEPEEPAECRLSFLAVGDIIAHSPVTLNGKTDSGYDFSHQYKYVKKYIESADLSFANLETPTRIGKAYSGYPRFNAPTELISSLKEVGFNILGTANNHMLDCSLQGYYDTVSEIRKNDMVQVGGCVSAEEKNYRIVEKEGIKVGMTAYTFSYNGLEASVDASNPMLSLLNIEKIKSDYEEMIKEEPDFNVIFVHWGLEYRSIQSESQTALARELAELGYDLIVGSHPHVVQPFEIIEVGERKVPVIYSLGNFISNQRREIVSMTKTEDGLIFMCDLVKSGENKSIEDINFIPTWVNKRYLGGSKADFKIIPTRDALENNLDEKFTDKERANIEISELATLSVIESVKNSD